MFVKGLAASLRLPSLVRAQDAPVDVVVIGAGAGGLAAAQALTRGGRTVTVIEASGRVGGRAHTDTETFGFAYDRGCAWLQGPQDMPHVRLARDEGFGLVDADTSSEALFHADRRATAEERAAYWRTWETVEAGLEEAAGDVAAASLRPADAPFLGTVEGWIGALDHGVDFDRLSTGDVQGYVELETNYLVREGLGALVAAQARDVAVVLDTAATRIDWSGRGVRVETQGGTISARAAIVTVSTGVLASGALRFTPDLPPDRQDALDAVPMGLLERIGLQFDGPRFDLPENGFLTQLTDALPPAPQCQFSPYQAGQDVIVGFIGGGFGWELARAGPEAAIDFALEEFVRAMGSDARRRFRRGQFSAWATNPLTLGAYSAARPGGHAMRRTLAEPLGDRVFFAGEAVAEGRYALMSGAHLSGARVGAQLVGRLNAEEGCTGCGARKSGLKTRETARREMMRREKNFAVSRRDPRYDILFEPVQIGPVTAKNRFYQVPHCNGMGRAYPSSMAEMRGIKAEGGWAVVCTEQVEIHHSSELSPVIEGRLWDDADLPVFRKMNDRIHAHGGLAGIEPCYDGLATPNRYSREIPMGPSARPVTYLEPVQGRAMELSDIRDVRKWYVDAARRAQRAGFDIVYVYAGHDLNVLSHFLSRRWNDRGDQYGGSLENRARLLREVLADTKDAIGDRCAVALRFGVDELLGEDGLTSEGEGRDLVEMLADIPDLWDVNVSDWDNDSMTSRFAQSGFQDSYVSFVKQVTQKPVVGVGRYTSPDAMVKLVRSGALDLIGAARPSIADPFLPKKVEEGRIEDIRECIGCNICVSADFHMVPMRCTQNPTMGEEWRRGWHPERIAPKTADDTVLIVGAGPAGLEATRALGERGYAVTLAEARGELGGRVAIESRLPGLTEWRRVLDYRDWQIKQMAAVDTYLESRLTPQQVLDFEADHVVIATGSRWCDTGVGREVTSPIPGRDASHLLTPDMIAAGARPADGPVVVFDDDHYYMGGVMAELLRGEGWPVTLVTPAPDVSHWTHNTLEQTRIQKRLMEMGVEIIPLHCVTALDAQSATLECGYTERERRIPCASFVPVTMRRPVDDLFHGTHALIAAGSGPKSLTRIGDCYGPGTIAAAVYSGHRFARELGEPTPEGVPFRRELPQLATD